MALHSTSIQDKRSILSRAEGFTFIELLIVVAILAVIITLGLFIGLDFYKRSSFRSEKDIVLSSLQKARSQSLNNINQARHGVYFSNTGQYVIFECDSDTPQCSDYSDADTFKNIAIDSSYNISITSPSLPFSIIFDQLSGDCVGCSPSGTDIIINSEAQSFNININNEGRVDWFNI